MEDVLSGERARRGKSSDGSFPLGGKSVAMEKEISLLGVDLVGVRLRPTAEGVIEGVITHASNCTVQTCLLLLLSRSKAAP